MHSSEYNISISHSEILEIRQRYNRPYVTLSYAQSLDGSISSSHGKKLTLSGPEAIELTHRLRASHDSILVGIGTVLSDDPRLTVRHVRGKNPQPVILDSSLRFPLSARLLSENPLSPWIVTTEVVDEKRRRALEDAGARIISLPRDKNNRVKISSALERLAEMGINSIMVEGGSRVIMSFLTDQLVERVVLTITPVLIGGLHAVGGPDREGPACLPRLCNLTCRRLGDDVILTGEPVWDG